MEQSDVRYSLRSLEIVESSIAPKPKELNGQQFNFDLSVEMKINPEKKIVFSVVSISVRDLDKTDVLGKMVTAMGFDVQGFDDVIKLDEHQVYIMPDILELTFRTIGLSTARGVMFSYFKGTYLNNAILPIITPTPLHEKQIDTSGKIQIK